MTEDTGGGRRRRSAPDRDWTKGSISGNLWALSWPIMVSSSLNMMGPTIDMIWIGKLGSAAVAGVGIAGMAVMAVNALMMGLFTGLRAMIARFIGAGNSDGANHVMQQAFVVGAVFSVFTALLGLVFAEQTLILFGVEADVVAQGAAYMRIQLVGMVTMSLLRITESSMQASGDTVTPMRVAIFYRVIHLGLAPALIFGWWIFPQLGVSGAALTNVISQSLGGILGLWFLFSGRTRLKPTLKGFHLDWSIIWRIMKVGIPAAVTGVQRNFPNLVLVWFVAPYGTFAVAAHSLTQRLDNFMRTIALALGQSTGILAGQNLGAGLPDRAERTGWLSAGLFTCIMAVASLGIWLWAENIIRVFNTEPDLVQLGAIFLRIQILGYMVSGFTVVLSTGLNGVGDTFTVMLVTLLTMWVVQIPLAYVLPAVTNLGVNGVRWAMVAAQVLRATFYIFYFRAGRWKNKKI
ncbi:MAG: MATE family efflux transporter [Dehalococcoidales bacterium]|jgi:putative MATE family efflux protein|nr:MATE family efflux transporter [Dehalococcoidales bacterium]MDP7525596.1 MATE family efflux transporter [Dehalococcoidales bacterium]